MLEIKMNENETKVIACGSPAEIMSDITMIFKIMHDKLEGDAKDFFEEAIKRIANEKLYAKSEEELEELNKKKAKEVMKGKEKELADLIKGMSEELKEILKKVLK